tara:strand:- start:239 stop:742 length:504 start_codon:yes stop_codon:yes gene_type:complete
MRYYKDDEVFTAGQVKRLHNNVSFSRVVDTYADLGYSAIQRTPKPVPSSIFKTVRKTAPVQDANGNWVEGYEEVDMFSDTVEDGVTTTKAEHETAHTARLDADAAASVRTIRDAKLAESDWMVIRSAQTAVAIDSNWVTYRQALRDITEHADFPHIAEEAWPTAPEA